MKTLKKLSFIMLLGAFTFSMGACKKDSCEKLTKKAAEASQKYAQDPTDANLEAWNDALEKAADKCGEKI